VSGPTDRLAELGLTLPAVVPPLAAYIPAVRSGSLVFTSGQLPLVEGKLTVVGKVGAEVSTEEAAGCARVAALNALAAIAAELGGSLDEIARVVRVMIYVASAPDFTAQAAVGNGASQLLGEIFGDPGRHARSAVGVAVLPMDSPVEVEVMVELASRPSVQLVSA
jgi:enamine deaminase RidA (YjgF/YER057c/UK114 family)